MAQFLLTLTALFLLRIAFLPSGPESWDAVDFVLGLLDYDLERFQPHFPGYPVYTIFGRGLLAIGLDAETALRATSALAWALLPLPVLGLVRNDANDRRWIAPVVAATACMLPGLAIGSARIESDLPGLLLVLLALLAVSRDADTTAGVLAGLALGVRLGALPLTAGVAAHAFVRGRTRAGSWIAVGRFGSGLALGCLVWWIPQLAVVGARYFSVGMHFVAGHFTGWGETAITSSAPGERLLVAGEMLWRGLGGGGPWSLQLVTGFLLVGGWVLYARSAARRRDTWLLYLAMPQMLTVLILQNPHRMRHYYPILLVAGACCLAGWLRSGRVARILGALLAIIVIGHSFVLVVRRQGATPPRVRAVRFAQEVSADRGAWVFCGESLRLFDYLDEDGRAVVRRARDLRGVAREINMSLAPPGRALVFSEVDGIHPGPPWYVLQGDPLLFDDARIEIHPYLVIGDPAREPLSLVKARPGDLVGERRWSFR